MTGETARTHRPGNCQPDPGPGHAGLWGWGPDTRAHTAAQSASYSRLMAAEMATARVTPA